jgi:t-SNARE complex subunit (syntaxin)
MATLDTAGINLLGIMVVILVVMVVILVDTIIAGVIDYSTKK